MTENVDSSTVEELSFRDATGRIDSWRVKHTQAPTGSSSGLLACRVAADDTGVHAVKRWVPEELARRGAAAADELEHEVRAGIRLLERYGTAYPDELVRLIGYNLDVAEPFILVSSPGRANPVEGMAQLRPDARAAFEVSLLRALVYLAEAGVAHHGLSPSTVYWDGTRVQIRDFGAATVAIRAGVEPADPRTVGAPDIWPAGSLILLAATGYPGLAGHSALEGRGQALQDLLAGVFDHTPAARPSAHELLARLNVTVPVPPEDLGPWQRFEDGRTRFDEVIAAKWPDQHQPPPAAPRQPPAAPRRPRTRLGRLFGGLLVLAALVVVLIMVVIK